MHSLLVLVSLSVMLCGSDPSAEQLLSEARAALKEGQLDKALELAGKAVKKEPKNSEAYLVRGSIYESARRHTEAIADFDKTIVLDPNAAAAYDHRGSEHLKLGHFTESIQDFDKFLQFKPDQEPGHWRRGISYYYAGKFEEGRKQFEGYQTVDNNDVENAVWRYLCMARASGVDKARQAILKVGRDRRVPMMEVYALYAGQAKPEDVLAAANAGSPPAEQRKERRFYAHLYLGLYYDAAGDKKVALEHITRAAQDYKIGHYMWDVAQVHRDLLRKELKR